ncbi:MAG: hypothetical protein IKE91_05055 [Clostridia bacterium]|nr:hypothetical protein [Clostridia bacterium]
MSNRRYTGPKARETMDARREAASDVYNLLYQDPEEIVNGIMRDIGLDERYYVGNNGRVSPEYSSTTPEERARASEQIQRELIDRCTTRLEETTRRRNQQPQKKSGPRRRVRVDRVAVVGLVATLLGCMGFSIGQTIISGARGDTKIEGLAKEESSVSDSITPGKEESSEVTPDVGTNPYQGSTVETDRIAYVVDFMDYYNDSERDHIMQLLNAGMIDGLGIRVGGSKADYPFTIKDFVDEDINSELQWYVDTGRVELDHQYGQELAWAESFITEAPITIPYYYTCAVNFEEAEIEAACIDATYKKMQKDMPGYDFKNRMAPITIDIEYCGDEKQALNEDYLTQIGAKNERTQAVLHLIDVLAERGVIDERGVIIYGDLNRMADESQINWDALFAGIEARNMNYVKWGTRAIRDTFDNKIEYNDIYAFRDGLLNTSTNIAYMKSNYKNLLPYLDDIAIQQIHLDQKMKTNTYGEAYDINITTANTLQAIVRGESINYDKGFIDRIEDVRMQEVRRELQQGDSQVEEYVPEEFKKSSHDFDDDGR